MTSVLLVCPEPLGHKQPAGVGIRFIEMARVLGADGHRVTVLSPDGGAVEGAASAELTPAILARASEEHDMAVVQGHAANALFAHGKLLPTVVDLYDPFIIENLHYYSERGAEVFQHDHGTLLRSLEHGDFFLCASAAQRFFYLGLLLAIGRLNPVAFESDPHLDAVIRIAPFGVQPPRQRVTASGHDVLFGGIYDWYDPILAIDALALVRKSIPDATLTFMKHPNPELTPQGKAAEAMAYVAKHRYDEFIRFEPWVPYESRGTFFDRFRIAVLTFPQSIETDLSMRTRVFDYLWGGLPVVTNPAPGIDELLARYNAGIVVPSQSADDIASAIVAAFERKDMSEGAARFVAEHQWPRVLAPLREFCRSPHFDAKKDAFAVRMQVPERPASILDRLKRRIGGAF